MNIFQMFQQRQPNQPILTNGGNPQSAGALTQTPTANTGNARKSGYPSIPDMQIGRSEHIGRIGSAILSNADQGLANALGAGGDAMYAVDDLNRSNALAKYQEEEKRRINLAMKAKALANKGSGKDNKKADVGADIHRLESALSALKKGGITGLIEGTAGSFWDRSGMGDTNRAADRLLLEELAVFATLEFTAKTKGAITDREMALFQRPIPKTTDDEDVWINWIEPRLEILRQVEQNGVSNEKAAQSEGSPSSNSSILDEADAIINGG